MPFHLPDLLQGTPPTFDAQAIRDDTDDSIICAGHLGYGVAAGTTNPVSVCTSTATLTASPVTLASLTGSATVNTTGSLVLGWPGATWGGTGGYFTAPTTGGGTALCSYGGISTNNFTNVLYISGGSGSIAASATLTSAWAVQTPASLQWVTGWMVTAPSPFAIPISLTAPGGGFAAAPPSTGGDRKDLFVAVISAVNNTVTQSIVQGVACNTVGWTRNTGSLTTGAASPVKPAWSASTPIVLAEIYVPGNATSLTAANIVDKSMPVGLNLNPVATASLGSNVTLTATTETIALTTASVPLGTYQVLAMAEFTSTSADQCSARIQPNVAGGGAFAAASKAPSGTCDVAAGTSESITLVGVVVVSTAGAIDLRVKSTVGSSNTVVKTLDTATSWANCTQIDLIRIG